MSLRIKCPRCGRILTARNGDTTVECNCHLYCPLGSKPSDCTITSVSGDYHYKWPAGVDFGYADERDNEHAVTHYCSTHDYYYSKVQVVVPVDWSKLSERAGKELRYWGGGVTS